VGLFLVMIAMLASGAGTEPVKSIDMVEVNHFYDHSGHRFDQVILWQWSHDYGRYDVVYWWLVNNDGDLPDGCLVRRDGHRYRAGFKRESWTLCDPESQNGKLFPSSLRLGF